MCCSGRLVCSLGEVGPGVLWWSCVFLVIGEGGRSWSGAMVGAWVLCPIIRGWNSSFTLPLRILTRLTGCYCDYIYSKFIMLCAFLSVIMFKFPVFELVKWIFVVIYDQ